MAEKSLGQFLSDVLNGRIPAVARLADLPAWWRRTPARICPGRSCWTRTSPRPAPKRGPTRDCMRFYGTCWRVS